MLRERYNALSRVLTRLARVMLLVYLVAGVPMITMAERDLLPQKQQEVTQFGDLNIQPLDQQNWKRPQSFFKWITFACGWEVPDDSLGRQGWYGNPRIKPKVPGVSVFPLEQDVLFIVYEIPALDAPMQMNADWFYTNEGGKPVGEAVGNDAQFLDMNEAYGYFELRKPKGGWKPGQYLVKIYVSSPGQQRHALSMAGTMQFAINNTEEASSTGTRCRQAGPQADFLGS
jgi:hypothetical protein